MGIFRDFFMHADATKYIYNFAKKKFSGDNKGFTEYLYAFACTYTCTKCKCMHAESNKIFIHCRF